jgi:signal transduction histidine kinase
VRRQLLLSFMSLTVVVLLLLEVPLGLVYAREQRRRLTALVERDALALTIRAEEGLEIDDHASVQTLVASYAADTGGRVVVVRPDGSALADSDRSADRRQSFLNRPEIRAALAREESMGTRSSRTLGHDILYVAVPVVHGDEVLGALRITYPTSYVDGRIRRGWWVLAGVGVIILLMVFLVSLRLARQVTVPIERLASASAEVGAGRLDVRAPLPHGPPELRDLTEQFNSTTARLERLVRAQRDFVADASHQLRTPLAAMRLRLENLESDLGAEPALAADVTGALEEVARLSRLVDGLLMLARAEPSDLAPERVALGPVFDARIQAWLAFAEEADVTIGLTGPRDLAVLVTPGHLEQILDNLLDNAIEVSPPGSEVEVGAAAADDAVRVWVADRGPGMSAEERGHALERFWRASNRSGGTGLGLAIVARLAEANRASVVLEPGADGGLVVVVTLPAG